MDGRLEMGLPGEVWHSRLIERLRLRPGDIQASGVIKNGRAEQCFPESHEWESMAQVRFEELYPHGLIT